MDEKATTPAPVQKRLNTWDKEQIVKDQLRPMLETLFKLAHETDVPLVIAIQSTQAEESAEITGLAAIDGESKRVHRLMLMFARLLGNPERANAVLDIYEAIYGKFYPDGGE